MVVRVVLVTGAAQGLGRCIADRFAEQSYTKGVVYCDLNISQMESFKEPEKTLCVQCDVRNRDQVDFAFKKAFERFGCYPNIVVSWYCTSRSCMMLMMMIFLPKRVTYWY